MGKSDANSSEHKIKRSDLLRRFGRGPRRGASGLLHYRGDELVPIQGFSSKRLKFERSLCAHCNTTRSQPFDRAYDEFIDWVMLQGLKSVCRRRVIDLAELVRCELAGSSA